MHTSLIAPSSGVLRPFMVLMIACTATRNPDEIDRIANEAIAQGEAVGISIAVAHGDAMDTRGYGFADREAHVPATAESVYPLASLSKQFWAVAALQLVERGNLDLDATVRDGIRVRNLLQQTSGLGDDDGTGETPAFPPGTSWHYSNLGAEVLHDLVRAKGAQLPACGDHVPLYEHGARGGMPEEKIRRIGFVCATAGEVATFEKSLGGLSPASIAAMRAPVTIDGVELPYGMFTRIADLDGHIAYGHTGELEGVSVAAYRFPVDDLTIVVLMNATTRRGYRAWDLLERIARARLNAPTNIPTGPPPADVVAAIVGDYEVAGAGVGTISAKHGEAWLDVGPWHGALVWRGGRHFHGGPADGDLWFLPASGPVRMGALGVAPFMLDPEAHKR